MGVQPTKAAIWSTESDGTARATRRILSRRDISGATLERHRLDMMSPASGLTSPWRW